MMLQIMCTFISDIAEDRLSLCLSVRGMSVISEFDCIYTVSGSYSTLSPVVHGDIALSINTNTKNRAFKRTFLIKDNTPWC